MGWDVTKLGAALGMALATVAGAGACAGGSAPCRVGADCPSGVCLADGRCAPRDGGTRDAGSMPMEDASVPRDDASTPVDAFVPPVDGGPPGCGDGDGVITARELPLPVGETLGVRVATSVSVDTAGVTRADGTRLWDLEGPFTGDADGAQVRTSVEGTWFASAFAGASYALPLSTEDSLLGVFERTDEALLLRGIVSPEGGLTRTELRYDPPVAVWRFPLEVGRAWDERTTVSGVASGVVTAYSERWQVSVDARGALGTPAGVRDVVRVSTLITRTVGVSVTPYRRLAFVEECVGTVGQVFGSAGVSSAEPSFASELWRVAR
jgi:hypothetical protein